MPLVSWIHRWISPGSVRQAWGLSPAMGGWCLVGLSRDDARLWAVHTVQHLPTAQDDASLSGVSLGLRQCSLARGAWRARQRINVGMAMDQLASGVLAIPVDLGPVEREAEVQLEAARVLQLEPEHISFDWQAQPQSTGALVQLHWVACPQKTIDGFSRCVRRAGWQLASVEPVTQAARRALACLSGGLSSVLTRPVQDWQLDPAMAAEAANVDDLALDQALRGVMQTPAGPRLVAAGLALKAWT